MNTRLEATAIYVNRLETVPFSVFSPVRETLSTGAAAIQNTEAQRLEYCPDCHLAQISLRNGASDHVLLCDGSLKGLAVPRVSA
jgi:hypothetical protein